MFNQDLEQGLLLVISGPSGVGKGTILKRLLQLEPDCCFSVSATTRSPRPGEIEGVDYHFVTQEQFLEWVDEDRFLEWNKHMGNFYGTLKDDVKRSLEKKRHVVLDIDVKGALEIMDKQEDFVSVFIAPPSWEILEQRLRDRGTETEQQIRGRLLTARSELKLLRRYQYLLVNDRVEPAVQKLRSVIEAEKIRIKPVHQQVVSEVLKESYE